MKHLEVQELWLQQLARQGIITIHKISTSGNPADILTKHVGRVWLDKVCKMVHVRFPEEKEDETPEPESEEKTWSAKEEEESNRWSKEFNIIAGIYSNWICRNGFSFKPD